VPHRLPARLSRLGFAAAAENALRPLRLDIVHDMGAGWYGDVFESHDGAREAQWERKLAMLPAWLRPLKRLLIAALPRYREFRKLAARQFTDPRRLVIAMSRRVAEGYQKYHGVPAERLRVIYHGVDAERFSPDRCREVRAECRSRFGVHDGELAIAFVGHDHVRKGLPTLLRAAGRLAHGGQPLRVLVAGGRGASRAMRQIASRTGVADRVAWLGPLADPLPCYAAADVFVLPSFYEPFGLVALEAAACGLPTIVSAECGASELFAESSSRLPGGSSQAVGWVEPIGEPHQGQASGSNGFVLNDPADDAELASHLTRLADSTLRQAVGAAARRLAEAHTWQAMCEATVAVYDEVLANRTPHAPS
jgi:UDP-glucose:(heptosyl)LPS alpha-1,3-glucosyltransferase